VGVPGYDREHDPSPDVYSVEEKDGAFRVRHFINDKSKTSCCHVVVKLTDADRGSDEPTVAALFRAMQLIEKKHGGNVGNRLPKTGG
jgi:hypothetical protein